MTKRIFLISSIIVNSLFVFFMMVIFFNKKDNVKENYIYGCQSELFVNENKFSFFVGNSFENYAIYTPNEKNNDISDAEFYGNINNVRKCNNKSENINLWNEDFQMKQFVITTPNDLKENELEVKVELENSLNVEDLDLKIDYGFSRFIYASYNGANSLHHNPQTIKKTQLIPDAVTEEKKIKAFNNKVYVVWIKVFKGNEKIMPQNVKAYIKVKNGKNIINNNQNWLDINILDKNIENQNKVANGNIFSFPEWMAKYYNEGKVPKEIKDKYDMLEYLNYNWEKYWKNSTSYLSNIDMEWVQMNVTYKTNRNTTLYKDPLNPWLSGEKNLLFTPWRFKKDKVDISSKNISEEEYEKITSFENLSKYVYIEEKSWEIWDFYIEKMHSLGMKKFMINSMQTSWTESLGNTIISDAKDENGVYSEIDINSSLRNEEGVKWSNWWFDNFKKHIDDVNKKGNSLYNEIKFYYYLDEKSSFNVDLTAKWLTKLSGNENKKYLSLAAADWERDINYSDLSKFDAVDYYWIYFLDVYNENNINFSKFVKRRNDLGLHTGQYSLDADNTPTLVRSEPGNIAYYMLALSKQGTPSYMKYILEGWNEKSYWTSDFDDKIVPSMKYISGDTLWAYPENTKGDGEQKKFISSTRLDNLFAAIKLVNKIEQLNSEGILNKAQLYENVGKFVKNGKKTSYSKFDFEFNELSVPDYIKNKLNNTFVGNYISNNKIDEISSLKIIINNLKKVGY